MQPGPTLYEAEERRKKKGSQGLLQALGEPMSYAPNPVVNALGSGLLGAQYLTGEKPLEEGLSALAMMTGLLQGTRVAPIVRNAGNAVRGMTEYEKRHAEAQRNAAKPVSQGGLGLPPDNTAQQRMKALGFDTDAYHGMPTEMQGDQLRRGDHTIDRMLGSHAAKDPRVTDPFVAGTYVRDDSVWSPRKGTHLVSDEGYAVKSGGNVLPLKVRGKFQDIQGDSQWHGKHEVLKDLDYQPSRLKGWLMKGRGMSSDDADKVIARFEDGKPVVIDDMKILGDEEIAKMQAMRQKVGISPKVGYSKPSEMVADFDSELFTMPAEDKKALVEGYIKNMKAEGFSGWKYKNQSPNEIREGVDPTSFLIMDPSAVRSRFAAFDPARKHEADIMGFADPRLLAAIGLGSGLLGYAAKDK